MGGAGTGWIGSRFLQEFGGGGCRCETKPIQRGRAWNGRSRERDGSVDFSGIPGVAVVRLRNEANSGGRALNGRSRERDGSVDFSRNSSGWRGAAAKRSQLAVRALKGGGGTGRSVDFFRRDVHGRVGHPQIAEGGRRSVHVPYWAVRLFDWQRSMGVPRYRSIEDENSRLPLGRSCRKRPPDTVIQGSIVGNYRGSFEVIENAGEIPQRSCDCIRVRAIDVLVRCCPR